MFVTNFKANYQELKKYPNKISNKSTSIYFYCLLYQLSCNRRYFLWMIFYFYLKTYLPLKGYCWPLFSIFNSNIVLVVRICVYISILSNNKICNFYWTQYTFCVGYSLLAENHNQDMWDTPFCVGYSLLAENKGRKM